MDTLWHYDMYFYFAFKKLLKLESITVIEAMYTEKKLILSEFYIMKN